MKGIHSKSMPILAIFMSLWALTVRADIGQVTVDDVIVPAELFSGFTTVRAKIVGLCSPRKIANDEKEKSAMAYRLHSHRASAYLLKMVPEYSDQQLRDAYEQFVSEKDPKWTNVVMVKQNIVRVNIEDSDALQLAVSNNTLSFDLIKKLRSARYDDKDHILTQAHNIFIPLFMTKKYWKS